eukprot:TRINITY_DN4409_c0_g1_i1.p2 TRINITY_DN4409_c0_g1~~TRINITY_DN4409_c0_g1_i1.p2  ORF type:complete len:278 (-),score=40.57 TRINITY_DN4409_c0_g1_i1:417-1181(-)
MCKWYCTSNGPSTNLVCLTCGCHYCSACLHGEAGKMESMIKCARCGRKPGVKRNSQRTQWQSPIGGDLTPQAGTPTSFVPGATGEDLSGEGRRSSSKGMYGPERFFYDRNSYTGTHAKGGPEHVAKGVGSGSDVGWKRPVERELVSRGASKESTTSAGGPTLLPRRGGQSASDAVRDMMDSAKPAEFKSAQAAGPDPGALARQGSAGRLSRRLVGPERFFYDKSTYTGCHTRGGPVSVAKGGGSSCDQSWKRPS